MKKIILTGGSYGLGAEIGMQLIQQGYEVVCLSRTSPEYECIHIQVDLTDQDQLEGAIENIKKNHADFVTIIHNAGDGNAEENTDVSFAGAERDMKLNVIAPMILTTQLLDLIKQNEADILFVGATVGLRGAEYFTSYSTSKHGLAGLVKNIRLDCKGTASRVIVIHPGGMKTPGNFGPSGRMIDMKQITGKEPPTNLMDPSEVAKIVIYALNIPKEIELSTIVVNRK